MKFEIESFAKQSSFKDMLPQDIESIKDNFMNSNIVQEYFGNDEETLQIK